MTQERLARGIPKFVCLWLKLAPMWTYKGMFEKGYVEKPSRKASQKAIKLANHENTVEKYSVSMALRIINTVLADADKVEGLGRYGLSMLLGFYEYGKPASARKIDKQVFGKPRKDWHATYNAINSLVKLGLLRVQYSQKWPAFGVTAKYYQVTTKGLRVARGFNVELKKLAG